MRPRHRTVTALIAAASACLALAPPAAGAGAEAVPSAAPAVGKVTAWAPAAGGPRLVVEARVRHGALSRRGVAAEHRYRVRRLARVTVRVGAARGAVRAHLPLSARTRTIALRHRVVLRGRQARRALAAVRAGRLALRVAVADRVAVTGEGVAARSRARARRSVVVRRPSRVPPPAAPRCERFAQVAPYGARTPISVVCSGHRVRLAIADGPRRGRARLARTAAGRAELTYRPRARFVGADRVVVRARAAGGATARVTVRLRVPPPRLRALGDSVTAGFGFIGNSGEMSVGQFVGCIPPDEPNDRCSSNSAGGPSSPAPAPEYLPDFGLANAVAWPAQFARARGFTGAGMYENRAVSGSTPADWASGFLRPQLQTIVADSPNLTVLTLGANPLLDTFLAGPGLACEVADSDSLFVACVQAFVDRAGLRPNLASVVEQLLAAPANRVVVSQYHLTMPALALLAEYTPHRLELLAQTLNRNVRQAVEGVDGYGERAFLIAPPRFDAGIAPGDQTCPGRGFAVDGPSRQSLASQLVLAAQNKQFCLGVEPWIISSDDGIHPNAAGYARFAAALGALVDAERLLPAAPR